MLQSAAIAGAISDLLPALPLVAEHTRYGSTMLLRLALLLVATLLAVAKSVIARRNPSRAIQSGTGTHDGRSTIYCASCWSPSRWGCRA